MNLALKITTLRLILSPVFVLVFLQSKDNVLFLWLALLIAFVSELSDYLDGKIARRFNLTTDFGKILDPLADSVSRLSIFLAFFQLGYANIWMILVFFYRDSLVSTLRIMAASKSVILSARNSGKLKAVFQAVAIFGVLLTILAQQYQIPLFVEPQSLITVFMLIAVAITVYSLWDYFYSNRKILKQLIGK